MVTPLLAEMTGNLHIAAACLGAAIGVGIIGMKERTKLLNGHFHISTYPGKGTQITVNVPLPKE